MTEHSAYYWLGRALASIDRAARLLPALRGATPFEAELLSNITASMAAEQEEILKGWADMLPVVHNGAEP